jgi:hypothetical protein
LWNLVEKGNGDPMMTGWQFRPIAAIDPPPSMLRRGASNQPFAAAAKSSVRQTGGLRDFAAIRYAWINGRIC